MDGCIRRCIASRIVIIDYDVNRLPLRCGDVRRPTVVRPCRSILGSVGDSCCRAIAAEVIKDCRSLRMRRDGKSRHRDRNNQTEFKCFHHTCIKLTDNNACTVSKYTLLNFQSRLKTGKCGDFFIENLRIYFMLQKEQNYLQFT